MADAGGSAPPRAVPRVVALLALLVFALAFQGSRGLYSPDEGRYTGVALEMLRSGDWMHPRLHHELPHYTKPPLTYWAIATSVGALGETEWSVRLPMALAFAGTVLLVLAMGRIVVPARPWLPALIYATALLPYVAANVVTTDTLLAFAIALYAFAFLRARASMPGAPRSRWTGLLGLGAGLAFICKGPPGLLPLVAMLGVSMFARGEPRPRHYFGIAGALAFVVVGFGWYFAVGIEQPELVRYFLVEEVWHRVASAGMHRNEQWYGALVVYVPALVLGLMPWSASAARPAWQALSAPRAAVTRLAADRDGVLLAAWILLPLAVFFVARSRLPFYVLPLFVPLALALGRRLADVPVRRWHAVALVAWLVAMLALRGVAAHVDRDEDDRRLALELSRFGLARIDELAFVDTAPRYGLMLYLDASVEALDLDTDEHVDPRIQDVAQELTEPEGCRLLLVPRARAADLLRELEADEGKTAFLGEVSGYAGYVADDASCVRTGAPAR